MIRKNKVRHATNMMRISSRAASLERVASCNVRAFRGMGAAAGVRERSSLELSDSALTSTMRLAPRWRQSHPSVILCSRINFKAHPFCSPQVHVGCAILRRTVSKRRSRRVFAWPLAVTTRSFNIGKPDRPSASVQKRWTVQSIGHLHRILQNGALPGAPKLTSLHL